MVKIITAGMLREKRACAAQLRVFEQHFPNGAEVSEALARQLHDVFVWGWAAKHLLTPSAETAYNEATASAWEAFNKAMATAETAYSKAMASARKARDEAKAQAFARAYLADDQT